MKKVYWFTGQAGAGKTVLANLLKKHFEKLPIDNTIGKKFIIIDGDDIRELYENKNYSMQGRRANVDFVQKLCVFLMNNKITPIVCMVSPFSRQREIFINKYDGVEIFVTTKDIRGREHYHVDYFEKPVATRKNVVVIDTTDSKDSESFGRLYFELSKIL